MHRVRYYERVVEPSYFQRGMRGWWIRFLNRVRLWVELKVVYHVMRYLAREDGLSKSALRGFVKEMRKDAREEVQLLYKVDHIPVPVRLDEPASEDTFNYRTRKFHQRRNIGAALERWTEESRAKRYTAGLPTYNVGDPEGDFDPVVLSAGEVVNMEVSYGRGETKTKTTQAARRSIR